MTETQGWMLISVLALIAVLGSSLFWFQYTRQEKVAVGSAWSCYDGCQVQAIKATPLGSGLINEQICENNCFTQEGLTPPWEASTTLYEKAVNDVYNLL